MTLGLINKGEKERKNESEREKERESEKEREREMVKKTRLSQSVTGQLLDLSNDI